MRLDQYRKVKSATACVVAMLMAYAVISNNIPTALAAVTLCMLSLYIARRHLTEVDHDERSILVCSKAASTTLAITTVGMAIIGLSLALLGRQGIGDYEQRGYLLAYQANIILALNALLNYHYNRKLGG